MRKLTAFIVLLLTAVVFSSKLHAQICSGTLNTVWKDDFGHGTDQLSPQGSPNITSGYTYEDFGVHEGHYALVNMFNYFGSWHVIPEDHTPGDVGGYFLVIDGNTAAPVFYETTVSNVCPFTQYSFSTFAMNTDLPSFPSDQTFTFIISDMAGNVLASWDSPPVGVNNTPVWVPMGFSFNSGNNTSLKLQAMFTATGYNDFAFDDFEFSVCGPTLAINTTAINNTCADSIPLFAVLGSGYANPVYQWQKKDASGVFVNIPGATQANYTDHLPGDSNVYTVIVGDGGLSCPIKDSIQVTVDTVKRSTLSKTICRGDNFEGHTTTGTYIDTLTASNGCDSIRTLQLTVNNCTTSVGCNNWLSLPSNPSFVNVGDLDIPGNKITVEAVFYQTGNSPLEGDLVSKHNSPADVNYLLRPNYASITTDNGFVQTPGDVCAAELNKRYHVAMVYDGTTLKFYRNGFLLSQVNATGNLFQNNWQTQIGWYAPQFWNSNFIGFINEVRIWNTVRTQNDIKTYMDAPLPNPATQTGLVAYYTFDDLVNKQGNSAWNGHLNGTATINNTVPDCTFSADSCMSRVNTGTSGIINNYAAVATIDICNNKITVDDATKFNIGDTIVIMQMKGAAIDSSNNSNFGTVTNYNNAGLYEFNYVKSKTGNTIEFLNTFLRQYDAVSGKVQLIRVPYFQSVTIADTLTCIPWDGFKGGVLVVNSATDVNLNAPIDVSNKGFHGGAVGGGFSCGNIDQWGAPVGVGGTKGEGITEYILGFEAGGARLANGGGGAYAANTGGGGGGNRGAGGLGGFHSNTCPAPTQSINGQALDYSTEDRIFLGGGGGGGQQDNNAPVAPGGYGGGIVIIKAATLNGNGQKIMANGETITTVVEDEGGAGGGAGGSILLFVNNYTGTLDAELRGGNGSSNYNQIYPTRCHGPGGGGGGGYLGLSANAIPVGNLTAIMPGGNAGRVENQRSACAGSTNGATNGEDGAIDLNLVITEATVPFKKNIDSVRIKDSLVNCKTFDFKGLAYINTTAIKKWQWYFGDGAIDSVQNTSHTYSNAGTHPVKLVVTDNNGCTDSISKSVITNGINFDFIFEQDACNPLSVTFKAIGDSTPEIFWSIGSTVTNTRNPVHVFSDTGSYLIQYSTGNINTGCIDTVKKVIFIGYRNADIVLTPDTTICFGTGKLLRTNIDSSLRFCWSPNSFLNNANFANTTTNTLSTVTYNLLAAGEENNLIINGDFNNGNSGFTSGYTLSSAGLLSLGEYAVNTSTIDAGLGATDCKDHTTGTGNMLIANSDAAGEMIWQQQVTVTPNTSYIFSTWVQSPNTISRAMLQLFINGNKALDSVLVPASSCTWKKYAVLWNSGNKTVAQLEIRDKTQPGTITGFDSYAIDDIHFSPYSVKRDTVKITVDTPFVNTRPDTAVCESVPVSLTTVGAIRYTWTPGTGLSNASIASPDATPADTTKYFVTGTNAFGCEATDSVTISVKPKPVITSTGDTMICRNTPARLFATGGGSYLWSPGALLDNATAANPLAAATTVNTKYIVTVTGTNNCINKDSFTVSVKPIPVFTVSADKSVCLNSKAPLSATGGNWYLWSPAFAVSNANIADPVAIAVTTTPYSVLIRDTLCGDDTTLTTTVTILPLPTVTASKENDINCAIGSTVLRAAGALQYQWAPATALNDATSPTPVASPINTTTYTVNGTDSNGCSNTAAVTVLTDYSVKVSYSMPNAFSPNGDDKNDCFRVKYFGLVQDIQLSIFNRWGQKVFFTTNPNDCWDGTYKGQPCDAGNFVYYLKAKTTCGAVERKGNVLLVR